MKKYIYYLLSAIAILQFEAATAQDVHFSQFYTTPLLVNPAQTGFFNGNYRLSGIYKNQWSSVTTPFSSFSGSADLSILNGPKDNVFGVGLMATSDKAGDANYSITNIGTALAFNKKLSSEKVTQYLGAGAEFNYSSMHFDYSNLHFDNEYFGTTNNEKIVPSTSFFDFSVGTEYNLIARNGTYFNLGAAMYHINQPGYSFATNNNFQSILDRKIVLNAGAGFKLNEVFELHPRAIYEQQGPQKELVAGSFLRIKLDHTNTPRYAFYIGSWYRWNDALIVVTRFDIDNFSFAFSYDVNTSSLTKASYGMGGPELSFLYTGKIASMGKKSVKCARF